MSQTKTAALNYDFGLRQKSVREEGEKLIISGLASNFDLDREDERMARHAFQRGLDKYLRENPILLYNHTYSRPMGTVRKAEVTDAGLYVEAELPRPEPNTEAMNVWKLVKSGIIRAYSVGGVFKRQVIGGVKTIVDVDLREISIAPVGVVRGALFSVQVGKAFMNAPTIEDAKQRLELLQLRAAAHEIRCEAAETANWAARARLNLL